MVSDDEYDEELTFFQKHKVKLIAVCLVLAVPAGIYLLTPKDAPKKKTTVSMVNIIPPLPPPPPPPPPPKERPPEPEQVKEEKFVPEEPKPDPAPADPAPAPMGTNLQGDGPDAFGLAHGSGNGMIGGNGRGRGGTGSKYGAYASQVQSRVVDALRNHKKTRSAALTVKVRVWADSTGRVTRATLSGTSGDAKVDSAIRDEILTGLQLQNPPPEGMPMPIVMRISATRPN